MRLGLDVDVDVDAASDDDSGLGTTGITTSFVSVLSNSSEEIMDGSMLLFRMAIILRRAAVTLLNELLSLVCTFLVGTTLLGPRSGVTLGSDNNDSVLIELFFELPRLSDFERLLAGVLVNAASSESNDLIEKRL